MHWDSKLVKNVLGSASKAGIILVLLFVAFSPLGQIFETQTAQAKVCRAPEILGGYLGHSGSIEVGDNEPCPENYTEVKNPGQGVMGQGIAEFLSSIVYVFTVGLGSLLAYIAGYFFNLATYLSLSSTAYALDFLTKGWESVRNLANMGFIFILIYIAVSITLSAETSKTMQTLVRVIAIALVINFSFFFVRIIIDGGNILAINFYNATTDQTVGESLSKADNTNSVTGNTANCIAGTAAGNFCSARTSAKDLTAGIMGAISIQTILNEKSFKEFADRNSSSVGGFFSKLIALVFIYICVGVIFGLLAAMFFVAGIKFISRVVVLWVVIISAPLALLMYAMPDVSGMRGYFKEWLNALIAYSLYPAVFLFLYIFIIQLTYGLAGCDINQAGPCTKNLIGSTFADINNTSQVGLAYILGLVATIAIKLGFIMILFMLAMQAAEYVSKLGGDIAQKITARPDAWAASLAGFSRAAATVAPRWATNYAYRESVGRLARGTDSMIKNSRLANSNWFANYAATKIRSKTTQPLTDLSIGGFASRTQYDKTKKEYGGIIAANNQDRQNRAAGDAASAQITQNLTSGKAVTEGINLEHLDRIQNINETRMKELGTEQIKTLSHVFTEGQMKVVEKLEKMSEQDKEIARKNFEMYSTHSPLRKAQKQIELLHKLNNALSDSNKIGKLNASLGAEDKPRKDVTINARFISDTLDGDNGINKRLAKLDNEIAVMSRSGSNTTNLRQDKNLLQKMAKGLEKLSDESKGIRSGVGGEAEPGSFKT